MTLQSMIFRTRLVLVVQGKGTLPVLTSARLHERVSAKGPTQRRSAAMQAKDGNARHAVIDDPGSIRRLMVYGLAFERLCDAAARVPRVVEALQQDLERLVETMHTPPDA